MCGQNNENMANKIRLAIITSIPFPNGLAATNRVISHSKGLVELGHDVTVLTTHYSNNSQKKKEFLGIKYKNFRILSRLKIFNVINLGISIFFICGYLLLHKKKFNAVLIVSNNAPLIVFTSFICKIISIKIIQEKSEFPFVLNNKGILGKTWSFIYTNTIYKLFDGMIIMTYPLEEYIKNKTKKKCKKIIIPMTVEPDRFQNIQSNNSLGRYIAYCGYMGGNKDGVMNLIKSFSLIESKFDDLQLLLIGTASEIELKELKKIAKDLKTKRVIFYGKVTRDQMPSLLVNAQILALARPSSLQSTGGFPTKLGEYLSTGKPVVVTDVGDISKYLHDGINAFIVEPDNNQKFAEKLEYVLNNYDLSLKVAQHGVQLTKNVFNYEVQAERLEKFMLNEMLIK